MGWSCPLKCPRNVGRRDPAKRIHLQAFGMSPLTSVLEALTGRSGAKGYSSSPQRINNLGGKTDKLAMRLNETRATRKEREISFDGGIGKGFTAKTASKLSFKERLRISGKIGREAFTAEENICPKSDM